METPVSRPQGGGTDGVGGIEAVGFKPVETPHGRDQGPVWHKNQTFIQKDYRIGKDRLSPGKNYVLNF